MENYRMNGFGEILKLYEEIPKQKETTNYFQIMGYSHYENIVSNILKFYFNPKADHGFEDLVLRSLLEISEEDFLIGGFNTVKIKREEPTEKGNRIDLIIETENYVIVIENKIYHHLNNDLMDYKQHIQTNFDPAKSKVYLVLSPNGIRKKEEKQILKQSGFKSITYKKLIRRIKSHFSLYAFSANSKYLIFFNEFITSIEKIIGTNMKDEKLKEFFLDRADKIEELIQSYSNFKSGHLKNTILTLKGHTQRGLETIAKNWIAGNILVHDFHFGEYRVAIDTIFDIDGFKITIFGRGKKSHSFIESDQFFQFTGLDKTLKPKDGERISYASFPFDSPIEEVAKELNELLLKIDKGNLAFNKQEK